VLEEVLSEVLLAGVRPLTEPELERVDQAVKDLRMDREVAKEVYGEVRRVLLAFWGFRVCYICGGVGFWALGARFGTFAAFGSFGACSTKERGKGRRQRTLPSHNTHHAILCTITTRDRSRARASRRLLGRRSRTCRGTKRRRRRI